MKQWLLRSHSYPQQEIESLTNQQKSTISRKESNIDRKVFLTGPSRCGKSSIAFNLLYEEASSGGVPLLICQRSKITRDFPNFCQKLSLHTSDMDNEASVNTFNPSVLAHIHLKYIDTFQNLIFLLAGIHTFQPPPSMIVIDDISNLIRSSLSDTDTNNHQFPPRFGHSSYPSPNERYLDNYLLFLALIDDSTSSFPATPSFLLIDTIDDTNIRNMIKRTCDQIISFTKDEQSITIKRFRLQPISNPLINSPARVIGEERQWVEEVIGHTEWREPNILCFDS